MGLVKRWDSQEGWNTWAKADTDRRSPRVVLNSIRLPFSRIKHIGDGSLVTDGVNDELIARWSFGQRQTLDADYVADNDDVASVNHAVTADGSVFISENGMSSTSKNGILRINENNEFNFPNATELIYISCWVKSNTTDYSSGSTLIAGYHNSFPDTIAYGIGINSSGNFKAYFRSGTSTVVIDPFDGDVSVNTDWHHLFFILGTNAGAQQVGEFIVDNNWSGGDLTIISPVNIGLGENFTIGAQENNTQLGFAGIIDELVVSKWNITDITDFAYVNNVRYESEVFLSPVLDTELSKSFLSTVYAEFELGNNASIQFSFRASDTEFDQYDSLIDWTGFTAPNQILTHTVFDVSDLGIYQRGRYHQVRIKLDPSDTNSSISDPLQLITPVLNILEISTAVSDVLLTPSDHAYERGTVIAQVVAFDGQKVLDKVSLNLTVIDNDWTDLIQGADGTISFQAANFQEGRDEWTFQPILHWATENGWNTSGTTIQNTLQNVSYDFSDDAFANAPYLKYNIYFPAGGIYDMWGYGYIENPGMWWSFSGDSSDLQRLVLGNDDSGWAGVPQWTKFGTLFLEEGGSFSFAVYAGGLNSSILDQWYFTTNTNLGTELVEQNSLGTPLPLSRSPFNTAVRIRSLSNGLLDDLESPQASPLRNITAWQSSNIIRASGQFNYEIIALDEYGTTSAIYTDGLSIEYWQIGGGSGNFAAWDFTFRDDSVGNPFKSINAGQAYE